MHPEIIKFWEDCGHEIEPIGFNGHYSFIKGKYYKYPAVYISASEVIPEYKIQYYYKPHNKWYYEKEMLKLVRLKAFL